jgi:WD40 repeat protein
MGFPADVIVWDFQRRCEIYRLSLHKVAVTSLSFSFNELYLATLGGQDDNSLVVWDMSNGTAICGTPAATDTAHTVQFYRQSDAMLVTGGNLHVCMWNFDLANKKLRPTHAETGQLKRVTTNVLMSADDSRVYAGTSTGDILEVSVQRGLFQRSAPKTPFPQGITCSALLPGGDLLVGTGEGTIARLSVSNLAIKSQCQVLGGVTSISLTQDGTHFFCGTSMANIYWVDVDSLTPELRSTCHHERVNQVAFPTGFSEVFATCSITDIRLWNSNTRQELLHSKNQWM